MLRPLASLPLALALVGLGSPARAEEKNPTCGQMLASKAVLPAKMSEVMTAVADMMDAHAKIMLEGKTPEGKKEAAALTKVGKMHRDLSKSFKSAADTMTKMADLPGAPHDMAKLGGDPKLAEAMKAMITTHKEMIALMQKEVAEMESMAKGPPPAKK